MNESGFEAGAMGAGEPATGYPTRQHEAFQNAKKSLAEITSTIADNFPMILASALG